jgi:hypothetical protein
MPVRAKGPTKRLVDVLRHERAERNVADFWIYGLMRLNWFSKSFRLAVVNQIFSCIWSVQ